MANGDVINEFGHKSGLFSVAFGAPLGTERETVVYLHGFPGSALEALMLHKSACEVGLRIISFDRPGFGASASSKLGATSVLQAGELLAVSMRELGVESYKVVAVSGGCPYALALASNAPEAVKKVVIVSGVGEFVQPGALDGMIAQNRILLKVAKVSPLLCRPVVSVIAEKWRNHPHAMLRYMARMLPGEDREILSDREFTIPFAESMQRGVRAGSRGPYEELCRLTKPWNIKFEKVAAPVVLFHGDADRYVPISHAHWLVKCLPSAQLIECKGRGHFMAARMGQEIIMKTQN